MAKRPEESDREAAPAEGGPAWWDRLSPELLAAQRRYLRGLALAALARQLACDLGELERLEAEPERLGTKTMQAALHRVAHVAPQLLAAMGELGGPELTEELARRLPAADPGARRGPEAEAEETAAASTRVPHERVH